MQDSQFIGTAYLTKFTLLNYNLTNTTSFISQKIMQKKFNILCIIKKIQNIIITTLFKNNKLNVNQAGEIKL